MRNKEEKDPYAQYAAQEPDPYSSFQTPKEETQEPRNTAHSLSDALIKGLAGSIIGSIGNIGGQIGSQVLPKNFTGTKQFAQGIGQGIPESLYSGARGVSQLAGSNALPEIEDKSASTLPQYAGQLIGKGFGYGAMAAPFVAGSEAVLPGLAGTLGGSAVAGGVLTPGSAQERGIGALEFAAPVAAIKAIEPLAKLGINGIIGGLKKVSPEKTYNKIVHEYDKHRNNLEGIFDFVSKEAKERGVNNVREIPESLFESMTEYGPKTKSFQSIINKAKTGDYDAIRKLYSKAGEIERKANKAQDWEKADIFGELKDNINEGLESHFANYGEKDLAQWLGAARGGWAKLKNIFESKYEPKIRKLVGENREYPETLQPLLGKRKSLENLLKTVPEATKDIEAYKSYEALKNSLKKSGYASALGIGLKSIKKLIFDNNNKDNY